MIRALAILGVCLTCVLIGCQKETIFYFSSISGYIKDSTTLTGVNGIVVDIYDYDASENMKGRLKGSYTTETYDGQPGFYKMDSVCYGSTKGILQIGVMVDSTKNPGYPTLRTLHSVSGEVEVLHDILIKRR